MDAAEKSTFLEREDSSLLEDDSAGSKSPPPTGSAFTKLKGVAAMLAFTLLMSISRICVQALDRAVPDFELNAIRCGFSTFCMAFYFIFTRTFPTVLKANILPVFLVALVTNLIIILNYISITLIPLATSESLSLTVSVFTGFVLFKFFNKEKLKCDKLIAAPLCVVGLFLVLQPPGIFPQNDNAEMHSHILRNNTNSSDEAICRDNSGHDKNNTEHEAQWEVILGHILAVARGLLISVQVSILKFYGDFFTTENLFISLIWSFALGTVLSLIPMFIFENPVFPIQIKGILLTSGHVSTYVFTMPLNLYGSLLISGNLGSIVRISGLAFILAAQYTILKDIHPGHRNWMEILGVILVLFGTIFSSLVEIFRDRRKSKETTKD